jgi:hypothetical protein
MFVFLEFVLNNECAIRARILWAESASIHNPPTGCPQTIYYIAKSRRSQRTAIVGSRAIRFNPQSRSWIKGHRP